MPSREVDAVIVGSGPNGLAAAIRLRQAGLSTLVIEGRDQIGGGTRTEELTIPGFLHDTCSAIHPMAVTSPFFDSLPLSQFGLDFIFPEIPLAHPFDDGSSSVLFPSIETTASSLGKDEQPYLDLVKPIVERWSLIRNDALGPFHFPRHPGAMTSFGLKALKPATSLAKRFVTTHARGLWGGLAAHAMEPLTNISSSAIGLVLLTVAHTRGWPLARGGSFAIAKSLAGYYTSIGGKIKTGQFIRSMQDLPNAEAILFDVTPRQMLNIAGPRFSAFYRWQLSRYRYGMGVFKIDWALDGQTPFASEHCRHAGTVHLGNTIEEIEQAELDCWKGIHPEKPFVLFTQPSIFDDSRAPAGKQVAWAYCHVPNGSTKDMTDTIERQVERFAPGFRDRILARHTMNTKQLEAYNPNYIGGDINGGAIDISQLFTRPALRFSPYRTSARGIYICSSSTPPGGGVHGMCGFHAAERVIKDIFSRNKRQNP